jgi:hypothetical protein
MRKEKTKPQLEKILWTWFSKFIRLRDKDKPCISCDRIVNNYHAGHYITRKYKYIKFHEDNVHKQCAYCNTFLEGNSADYRKNLIKKIGLEKVEYLEMNKGMLSFRSKSDYKEMIEHYKSKVKQLEDK